MDKELEKMKRTVKKLVEGLDKVEQKYDLKWKGIKKVHKGEWYYDKQTQSLRKWMKGKPLIVPSPSAETPKRISDDVDILEE